VIVAPEVAVAPVPVIRSLDSSTVGGGPGGTVTVGGRVPNVPAAVGLETGAILLVLVVVLVEVPVVVVVGAIVVVPFPG
jgi:hypothetical protein